MALIVVVWVAFEILKPFGGAPNTDGSFWDGEGNLHCVKKLQALDSTTLTVSANTQKYSHLSTITCAR